jgi:hypothetical protein
MVRPVKQGGAAVDAAAAIEVEKSPIIAGPPSWGRGGHLCRLCSKS